MKSMILSLSALAMSLGSLQVSQLGGLAKDALSMDFSEYLAVYDISIPEEEMSLRRSIFESNKMEMNVHNEDNKSGWDLGLSPFAHLTHEEFRKTLTLKTDRPEVKLLRSVTAKPDISDVPKNVDWRDKGVITPVKNQGMCGSCWAFAATEAIESYHTLKTGKQETLAPQQMVECTDNPRRCGGAGGCQGATEQLGIESVVKMGGIARNEDYPYTSGIGKWDPTRCRKKADGTLDAPIIARVERGVVLEANSYEHVIYHLANVGPLSVALDATPLSFYRGGVFDGCPKGKKNVDVNHAVQLVGYGENEKDGKFWIVRNSWGERWGEKGYIRIRRNEPNSENFCGWNRTPQNGSACADDDLKPVKVCGPCGILSETQYVVMADSAGDQNYE